MPEYMTSFPMTSLTLDAIACKEEDAVVVEYILKGQLDYPWRLVILFLNNSDCPWKIVRLISKIIKILLIY